VREAKGDPSAQLIDHLKKGDMAREAERLLDGTGWLPEPLRLAETEVVTDEAAGEVEALPAYLTGDDEVQTDTDEDQPHVVAAE
jgi:ParB family chromosome partitioning protein